MIFNWWRSGYFNLYWQPADGSMPAERLTTRESQVQIPGSISRDGKTLAYEDQTLETDYDVTLLDMQTLRVTPLVNSRASERGPAFSPDGHWLAYGSNETGRTEVYVIAMSGRGGKIQISNQGGTDPLWAKDGRQLFYHWGGGVWVVDTRTEGGFSSGKPRLLFKLTGFRGEDCDLSLDGQRFLMVKYEDRKPQPITELILVQNWFEELKRLVPAGRRD